MNYPDFGKYYIASWNHWLYHKCPSGGSGYTTIDWCSVCKTETPKNIMMAFKLWKWHNNI